MKIVYGEPFVSPIVRLQYVNVAKPDEGHKFSRGNYNVTALLPKKDKKGFKQLMESVAECAGCEVENVDDLEKHPLLDGKGNLRDGDSKKNSKKEGHAGHYFFITASSNPIDCFIENEDGEVEECDPKEIYSGCYARLTLQPAMYEEGEITFFLQGVMKVDEGDRFTAGRTDTKQLFANWAGKGEKVTPADEDEDEKPKKKRLAAVEEEDDEEDEKPKKRKAAVEDDEEEETTVKRGRGRPKKVVEEDDEEEETPKKRKTATSNGHDEEEEESEEEETDDDEEEEAPKKRTRKAGSSISALLDDD